MGRPICNIPSSNTRGPAWPVWLVKPMYHIALFFTLNLLGPSVSSLISFLFGLCKFHSLNGLLNSDQVHL